MDILPEHIGVYGDTCVGCKENKRDFMLAFSEYEGKEKFNDVFLTLEEAEKLNEELSEAIKDHKERKRKVKKKDDVARLLQRDRGAS